MPKIIFAGKTKKGRDLIVRYPEISDAPATLDFVNKISAERTYLLLQGEQKTLEDQKKWFQDHIAKIEGKTGVMLVAFLGDKYIGSAHVDLKNKSINSHIASFGIALDSDFRGEGIGEILMKSVINEAEKSLPGLKIIDLDVFGNNIPAQRLYKKLGFIECGRMPEGVFHRGEYVDGIWMYKKIR